jgi:Anti-anti-sigma regulatory factor (antagonist of anti-sigma factor)
MQMVQEELDGGILKVTLTGSFDIAGAADVDMPFNVIAGARDRVILDFTGVDFLASIGVRLIVRTAKSLSKRGGMAIVNPNEPARKVLAATGVDSVVHVCDSEEAAVAALS